ncbi:MAG: hypothetical protein R3260_17820 [Pseudomonas sp.]|nr:hypothetical protein [Pseudomonas sp.]
MQFTITEGNQTIGEDLLLAHPDNSAALSAHKSASTGPQAAPYRKQCCNIQLKSGVAAISTELQKVLLTATTTATEQASAQAE